MAEPLILNPRPERILARLKRRTWGGTVLRVAASGLLVFGLASAAGAPGAAALALGLALLTLLARLAGRAHRTLDRVRLAEHLDRCFPELEESAALLQAYVLSAD